MGHARRGQTRRGQTRRWLAGIAAGAALGLCAVASSGCVLLPHANQAKGQAEAVGAGLAPAHPKLVCGYGDSGYGLDNTEPWEDLYYTVDDSPALDAIVRQAGHDEGYDLHDEPMVAGDEPYSAVTVPAVSVATGFPVGGIPYDPRNTYLKAAYGGRSLEVDVVRAGAVALLCPDGGDIGGYGRITSPAPGRAIVRISVLLPSTDKRTYTPPSPSVAPASVSPSDTALPTSSDSPTG